MDRFTHMKKYFILFTILSFSLLYVGCGGSEEAMSEDEMVTDIGYYDETPEEEVPQEVEEQPDTTEQIQQESQPQAVEPVPTEGPNRDQLQSELDEMKTENIQLRNQLSASEQKNKDLSAKVSDLEAALQASQRQVPQPKAAVVTPATPAGPGKSSADEVRMYTASVDKFNTKAYRDVISEMQTLLNTGIKDDYADNCHYWIGLSYFQLRDHESALEHFKQVMNYRYSEKSDDAQMMIARTYERMGNKEQSLAEYQRLIDMYPASEYVGRARARMR
jgi:TolA-binding protein